MMRKLLVLPVLTALFACGSGDRAGNAVTSPEDLLRKTPLPEWAYPQAFEPDLKRHWLLTGLARTGTEEMKPAIARLRYLTARPELTGDLLPYAMLTLARMYVELDMDRPAYRQLDRLRRLPDDTPFSNRFRTMPDLAAVKRRAAFLQARILARNGFTGDAEALIEGLRPATTSERTEAAATLLAASPPQGRAMLLAAHADTVVDGPEPHLIVLQQVMSAYTAGYDSLATAWIAPYLDSARTPLPKYQRNVRKLIAALHGLTAAGPAPAAWRDGTFTGTGYGFVGPVNVSVDIFRNRIAGITVTASQEDRPWSALTVLPQRMVKKQSLNVDAVSGATVTSCAVVTAVGNALRKAAL